MTQIVPAKQDGFGFAYPAEEGGVYWDGLTGEQWERLKPYEGRILPTNLILMIANRPSPQGVRP